MKYLYVLLAFSFLFSCKDENKKHAESVLREWMNKEIVFPHKSNGGECNRLITNKKQNI